MPLDAMNGRPTGSLADYLTSIGVVPVPMWVLQMHKDEQIRKNPPHILFTPVPYVAVGGLAYLSTIIWGASNGLVWAIAGVAFGWAFGLVMAAMFAFTLTMTSMFGRLTFRGPAKWVEKNALRGRALNPSVPPAIREVTEYVRRSLPGAYVIQGDLIQHNEVIDPYIVIQLPTDRNNPSSWSMERACLGIWDGERIYHCARIIGD